jgi:hypothetical protein
LDKKKILRRGLVPVFRVSWNPEAAAKTPYLNLYLNAREITFTWYDGDCSPKLSTFEIATTPSTISVGLKLSTGKPCGAYH